MRGQLARPARHDVLVAGGCATVTVGALCLLPVLARVDSGAGDGVPEAGALAWWVVVATLVAQSMVLLWRRRCPEVVAGAAAAAVPVGAVVGMGAAIGLTSLAVLVSVYSLATERPLARSWPLLAATGVLVAAGNAAASVRVDVPVAEASFTGIVQAVGIVVAPLVLAALVVARGDSRRAREDRLAALDREYEALVAAAVARERTAMARELHDIAAHHLTGIAVLSSAIATQIDTDPTGAKEAIGEVRRQSASVLRDLRSLVGLLRDHDESALRTDVRVETLAGIPGLVAEVAAAGHDVSLSMLAATDGRAPGEGVGPLAQLAAYRTVQESLANAGRHAAGARCEVQVDDRDTATLVVAVRNATPRQRSAPSVSGGLGLVGMRERAELTGSELVIGATVDGGWQVQLRIPRFGSEGSP